MFNHNFIWYGLCQLSTIGYIAATLALTHMTIIAVTLYLHRAQSHRAIDLHPSLCNFFRFWLWLTTSQLTNEWVAIHRYHHANVETNEDPHSPWHYGIWRVLFMGAWIYGDATQKREIIDNYAHGTPNDWIEKKLYQPYKYLGLWIMLATDLLLFGLCGSIVWAVQMIWIPFHAAGVINGLGHYLGYRNFECPDGSTNIVPWAFWIGGEELHNNHHAFPDSAKLSIKWYEFDLGYFYIQCLSALGLATVRRLPPEMTQERLALCRTEIDRWKVLVANRLRIMERLAQDVIIPMVKKQAASVQFKLTGFSSIKQLVKTMVRHSARLTERERGLLELQFQHGEKLRAVYNLCKKLETICHQTRSGQKEMFTALKKWCEEASRAEIPGVEKFTRWLENHFLHHSGQSAVSI